MTFALLTTSVAKFTVPLSLVSEVRQAIFHDAIRGRLEVYNLLGELVRTDSSWAGEPHIWTHTPVPYGMDLEALKRKFEQRASSVLGDYDSEVDFSRDPVYPDGRYLNKSVRAAWMMYVDQAIEQRG